MSMRGWRPNPENEPREESVVDSEDLRGFLALAGGQRPAKLVRDPSPKRKARHVQQRHVGNRRL